MREVNRYGFIIDRVYGHDKFGEVCRETDSEIYVLASDFDAALARETALLRDQEDKAISIGCLSDRLATAQSELAALREELAEKEKTWTARFELICEGAIRPIVLERNAFEKSLTVAEQRNAELVELLRSLRLNASPALFSNGQLAQVDAALNPTESGASE